MRPVPYLARRGSQAMVPNLLALEDIVSTCRQCAHFEPDGDSATSRGSCGRWVMGYGINPDSLAANEVLVENDEGWGMSVGPDFGCVLWQTDGREPPGVRPDGDPLRSQANEARRRSL